MRNFLWIIVILAALLAGFITVMVMADLNSGIQERATGMVLALLVIAVPYSIARAVSELLKDK